MLYSLDEEKRRYKSVAANLLHATGWLVCSVFSGLGFGLAVGGGTPGDEIIYLGIMALALFVAIRALRMEVRVVDDKVVTRNLFSMRAIPLEEIQEFRPIGNDTIAVGVQLRDGREVTLSAVSSFRRGSGTEIFSHKVVNSLNGMLQDWRLSRGKH